MDEAAPELPLLSAEQAWAIIAGQFPELAGLPVVWLGEGSDHRAFAVGEQLVFRFPKHAEAADRLHRVARLAAWLAPQLPLALPVQRFVGPPSAAFPAPFSGEDRITGRPALIMEAPTGRHAYLIGRFLKRLHDLPADQAAALGLEADDDPQLEAWSAAALDDLSDAVEAEHLPGSEAADWQRLLLGLPRLARSPALVIHGDFAAEHVLLDEDAQPTGVIDWSDAMLGDPAQDLAGLLHWGGPDLLRTALEAYGHEGEDSWPRARFYAVCRALADLSFGRETGRSEYVAAGLRALAWLRPPT